MNSGGITAKILLQLQQPLAPSVLMEIFRDNVANPRLCRKIIAKIAPSRDIVARNAFRDKYSADDFSDIVIELFRAHKRDAVIQEFALWTTHVLSFRPKDRKQLTAAGVCGAIVSCLQRHQANARITHQASWAIQNLSVRGNNVAMQNFVDASLCGLLVSCFRQHEANKETSLHALKAIKEVCLNVEAKKQFTRARVFEAIMPFVRRHMNDANMAVEGVWVLRNLCAGNNEGATRLHLAGGITLVLACLRKHRAQANMAWHGLWAIASLCQRDELTEKVLAAAACDDVVFGIHQHGLSQRDAMVRGCYITKYIIYNKYI